MKGRLRLIDPHIRFRPLQHLPLKEPNLHANALPRYAVDSTLNTLQDDRKSMTSVAVSVDELWKQFRLYYEKNQYLKTAVLHGGRSKYEEFWALQDVSFEINQGSTFGIIGSNGSGKSTLLKCLTGILTPDRGNITVNGRIAALLELGAGFHPEMSGRENIFLNGAILGMTAKEIQRKLEEIIDFAGLENFIDTPVKHYSSGMAVRLGFAVAINVEPEILIIDEVLAVGDTAFQQKCMEKIEGFKKEGKTIILVSHGLGQVAQICDSVAWIEKGLLKQVGKSFDVVNNYNAIAHNAQPTDDSELGQRWGSGEVSINKITVLSGSDAIQNYFETGSDLTIEIELDSSRVLENCNVVARLTHLHGTEVWATSTENQEVRIPIRIGSQKVTLNIKDLPLLEGTFDLSVSVSEQGFTNEFDHWEKRIRFNVHQNQNFDIGLVRIKSNWSVS
jgi:ABC-2 type transport system ATP-binding protein